MLTEIRIKNAQFIETDLQGGRALFGIVRGDSFRDIDLPTTPNPRAFCGKANKNYKRMLHTLISEPHMFIHKNASGITMFASDFRLDGNGGASVFLNEAADGIANGGHSYEALKNFGTAKAHVKMQIVKGLSDADLVDVAESLNTAKKIELYSLENAKGRFDWHKAALGDLAADVSYREGGRGLTDVRESIGALHVFLFAKDGQKRAVSAYRGSVNVNHHALKKLEQDSYANQVRGIARDVHLLHRHVIVNEHFLAMCGMAHAKGWRRRLPNGTQGITRSVTNLILLGVAIAGTRLEGEKVVWKPGFQTHELRCSFANDMFQKVFDILLLEDGILSHACKRQDVIERVERHALILGELRGGHEQLQLV